MIVLCVFIDKFLDSVKIKDNFNKLKNNGFILLLLPFFIMTFIGGPFSFERKIDREKNILESVDSRNEILSEVSKHNYSESY